jgi:hypothetical protein
MDSSLWARVPKGQGATRTGDLSPPDAFSAPFFCTLTSENPHCPRVFPLRRRSAEFAGIFSEARAASSPRSVPLVGVVCAAFGLARLAGPDERRRDGGAHLAPIAVGLGGLRRIR